jgi:hypothetical protein
MLDQLRQLPAEIDAAVELLERLVGAGLLCEPVPRATREPEERVEAPPRTSRGAW